MRIAPRTLVASSAALLVLATGAVWSWRNFVVGKQALTAETTVGKAIEAGDFLTARSALPGLTDPEIRAAKELEIRTAEVNQALKVRDTALLRLATADPLGEKLDPALREAADLKLAREAIWLRDFELCESLISRWEKSPTLPGSWVLLHADLLLARRDPQAARELLENAELSGPDDALRHARIALLHGNQPWKAMDSLDAGLAADPRNAEILSFRAQIEEAAGRIDDARLDYVAAVLSEPENPLHRDILANFQLRIGEPSNAAETWLDAAQVNGFGIYAFKAWFWSRACGIPLTRELPEINQTGWKELVAELSNMQQGAFWSPEMEIPLARVRGGSSRPEVVWLRLLESIRSHDWTTAANKIETGFPREAERLAPGLSTRLLANLTALAGGAPRLALAGRDLPEPNDGAHPFLNEFHSWTTRPDSPDDPFVSWLRNPASPAATLFSYGWHGAALDVANGTKLQPAGPLPDWFDFGYSRCLLVRNGPDAARQWLESLPTRSTAADLTYGEILLNKGPAENGLKVLAAIAEGTSTHASRAAWTLALYELQRGQTTAARDWVNRNKELAQSTRGREITARAALAEGKREETTAIYQELGSDSVDAMIFLSKEAFSSRDWPAARKWTSELARRFPSEPQFRKNLLRIQQAQSQGNL
ncbi:MAG: tetratricopeptide repeat protein [Verrucomicrobiales bacterium]|nr:hypothetical protein [Verrucomicrobiota bacterium JB025]